MFVSHQVAESTLVLMVLLVSFVVGGPVNHVHVVEVNSRKCFLIFILRKYINVI